MHTETYEYEYSLGNCRACHKACVDCRGPTANDCSDPNDWNYMYNAYGPTPEWEWSNFPEGFEVNMEVYGDNTVYDHCCADGYNVDPDSMLGTSALY